MNDDAILKKLDEISAKLTRLMVIVAVSSKDEEHQLRALSTAGFSSADIEAVTGIPSRTIRDRLGKGRKRR